MPAKVKIVERPTVFSGAIGTPKYSHRDKKALKLGDIVRGMSLPLGSHQGYE